MSKHDKQATRLIVLCAAQVVVACCMILTVRQRVSDNASTRKSKEQLAQYVIKAPTDVASQLRLYHRHIYKVHGDIKELRLLFDKAFGIAGKYPGHVILQRRMLALASDIMRHSGADDIFQDGENRKSFIAAATHLLSLDNINALDLEAFTHEKYFLVGEVLSLAGSSEEAIRRLAEFVVESGRWDRESDVFLNEAWQGGMTGFPVSTAWALRKYGRNEEAMKVLSQHVKRFPQDAAAHFAIADTSFYMKEYDWNFTESHYKKVFNSEPGNAHYRKWYGIHLYHRKEYAKAGNELKRAVSAEKPDAETFFFLGKVNENLGNRDQAKENYKSAVKFDPNNDKYREALKSFGKS